MRRWRLGVAALLGVIVIAAGAALAATGDRTPRVPSEAAAATIGVDQQRSDPNDVVFDPTVVRTFQLEISDEEYAKLRADPFAETYVRAAVTIDGVRYEPVGIRYKGFFGALRFCFRDGRQICDKLSWKLKFNHFEPSLRLHGLKRLNFHSMKGDETQMREVLAYQVYRDAGVIAPRSVHAKLELNGKALGLFAMTEDIDDRFIADRFRDRGRGVLYKEVWPGNIDRLWVFQNTLTDAIARGPLDPSGIRRFSEAIEEAETAEARYAALIDQLHDPETFFNYLAADRLMDNWDGIVAWYCSQGCGNHNYFWYEDALSGGFTLVPWDLEHTWRSPSPIRRYYDMPDWDDTDRSCRRRAVFLNIPAVAPHCDPLLFAIVTEGWGDYIEASRRLLRETLSVELMHERIEAIRDLIAEHVAADGNGPGAPVWREHVRRLFGEVSERWEYIDDKIDAYDRRVAGGEESADSDG